MLCGMLEKVQIFSTLNTCLLCCWCPFYSLPLDLRQPEPVTVCQPLFSNHGLPANQMDRWRLISLACG